MESCYNFVKLTLVKLMLSYGSPKPARGCEMEILSLTESGGGTQGGKGWVQPRAGRPGALDFVRVTSTVLWISRLKLDWSI